MANNQLSMPRSPHEEHDFWKDRILTEHKRTQKGKMQRDINRIIVATPTESERSTVTNRSTNSVSKPVPYSGFPGYSEPEQIVTFKRIHGISGDSLDR